MTPPPVIRPAATADLIGLMSVRPDERLHRERLASQDAGALAYLVASASPLPISGEGPRAGNNAVYGFVLLLWAGDEQHPSRPVLADLLVRELYRCRGLGARLMERAEALCRARDLPQIGLSVNPTDNPRAHALYLRRGYRDTGQPPHCEQSSLTDAGGRFRLHEDWCLSLAKDLTPRS